MQPVDFNAFAQTLLASGEAMADYAWTQADQNLLKNMPQDYHLPLFPGRGVYGNGPFTIEYENIALPQALIDIQYRSFRDAMHHYMPMQQVARHICHYARSNYRQSSAYKRLGHEIEDLPEGSWAPDKPESLSFKFDDIRHKSKKRDYFTITEARAIYSVHVAHPEILESFRLFQAGQIDYLMELEYAFRERSHRPNARRACHALDGLIANYETKNFITELGPCVMLSYRERDPSLNSAVEEKDFAEGYRLAIRLGVFQNHVAIRAEARDGQFKCPARPTLAAVMGADDGTGTATIMGMICKALQRPASLSQPVQRTAHQQLLPQH